jgi:hypothetical protein
LQEQRAEAEIQCVHLLSASCAWLFIAFFQLRSRLALYGSLQLGFSLVIHFLTASDSNFDLDSAVF